MTPMEQSERKGLEPPSDILTTRPISHDEATAVASRLINSHFGNTHQEQARVSIPARPDYDDDLLLNAYIRQQRARSPEPKDGAAPSPETGGLTETRLRQAQTAGDNAYWRWRGLGPRPEGTGLDGMTVIVRAVYDPLLAAAPAAPSPDLAALEELAERWEHGGASHVLVGSTDRARYAAAIRSILKAQPNAGPSADGGMGGR